MELHLIQKMLHLRLNTRISRKAPEKPSRQLLSIKLYLVTKLLAVEQASNSEMKRNLELNRG